MKRYEVNCVEHGEFFYFVMESNDTNPDKVMEQARDEASIWGAEVMFVKPTEEKV